MLRITIFFLQYFPMLSLPTLEKYQDVDVTYRPVPVDLKDIFSSSNSFGTSVCMQEYLQCASNEPSFTTAICAHNSYKLETFMSLCEMRRENCVLAINNETEYWHYYKDLACPPV
ncbi:uncharacterized protein [Choristoneura fumiferana]|uniref:uncharacterized protein n=1 Tax=Choristoneura fumiferana TaxID=7141 RepID=UPI003D154A22